jgi:AcrR family transcriptional regulator
VRLAVSNGGAQMGPERRTQEQRSAETKLRLLTATLECLIEDGYVNTTMSDVAVRAGVSRGAQTHHFPSKLELMVAAADHLFSEFAGEVAVIARAARDGEITLEQLIDELWQRFFCGRFMYASLELIVASRSDPELRDGLVPLIRKLHTSLDETWLTFFRGRDVSKGRPDVFLNLTLCLFRGMVVQTVLRDDPPYYEELIDTWKRIVPSLVSGPAMTPADGLQETTRRQAAK